MKRIIFLYLFLVITLGIYSQNVYLYLPESRYVQVKDTVFQYDIYQTDGHIDSIVCGDKMTKLSRTKWIGRQYPSGSYFVRKFRKVKPSPWFKENNGMFFQADHELQPYVIQRFDSDGTIFKYWRFGTFSHSREIKPKNNNK